MKTTMTAFRPNGEDNDIESEVEDNEVNSSVSEDVIDGCIIISSALGKEKEKKDDANGAKCTAPEAPSASIVSNLIFYLNTGSRSHSRESSINSSSVNRPSKKRSKDQKGQEKRSILLVHQDRCGFVIDKTIGEGPSLKGKRDSIHK